MFQEVRLKSKAETLTWNWNESSNGTYSECQMFLYEETVNIIITNFGTVQDQAELHLHKLNDIFFSIFMKHNV